MTIYNAFQNFGFQSPGFQQTSGNRRVGAGNDGVRDPRAYEKLLEFLRQRDAEEYADRTYEKAIAKGEAEAAELRVENQKLREAIDSRRKEPDVLRSLLDTRRDQEKKLDLLKPLRLPSLDELLAA